MGRLARWEFDEDDALSAASELLLCNDGLPGASRDLWTEELCVLSVRTLCRGNEGACRTDDGSDCEGLGFG